MGRTLTHTLIKPRMFKNVLTHTKHLMVTFDTKEKRRPEVIKVAHLCSPLLVWTARTLNLMNFVELCRFNGICTLFCTVSTSQSD